MTNLFVIVGLASIFILVGLSMFAILEYLRAK